MLGSSGVTKEEKPRSLSKHLFITSFSSEWGIHRSFQLVLLALTQLSCSHQASDSKTIFYPEQFGF